MIDSALLVPRIQKLRELMEKRGWDAVCVRRIADIEWLCGVCSVFDSEIAHTAFITAEGFWLHTDSRYYNALMEALPSGSTCVVDQEPILHPEWVATRVAECGTGVLAIDNSCTLSFFDDVVKACPASLELSRMQGDIVDLRMVKDEFEIECMRQAQKITDDSFDYICSYIKPGQTEMDIKLALERYLLTHGASATSFSPIIAAGANGVNPHAQPSLRRVSEGDMIVIDWGAICSGYCSDMTRTVCMGTPSAEQRRVYDIVRETHEACAAAAHAGVIGSDIHNLSVKMISDAGYGEFYGHGLGHGVGLEIHEYPAFGLRYNKVVPAHSVVTIEPGIYLPGKFGVRIEDYGIVEEDGYHPFTTSTHALVCISC